jgi:accessory gene regulator B
LIERLALKYANYILKNASNPSSIAVNKYGAQTMMEFLLFAAVVLVVTSSLGDTTKGIISLVAFPLLRYFSGGLHMKSVELCQIISGGLVLAAIYLPVEYWNIGFGLNVLSALILLYTAPSNIKKSRIDSKYYPVLKIIAVLIVCSNFYFQSELLSKQFFVQSLTTLSFFQKKILEYRL